MQHGILLQPSWGHQLCWAVLGCPWRVWAAVGNAAVRSVYGREPKQGSGVLWVPVNVVKGVATL